MASKFKQPQLPFSSREVEDAIKEREGDLTRLGQDYVRTETECRKIQHKLTRKSTGAYPDPNSKDPLVHAAHNKSIRLLEEYERLAAEVPAKTAELEALQAKADGEKGLVEKILSEGSSNAVDIAALARTKCPAEVMMILVQAVTVRRGSIDFLRNLSNEHRELLLSKEEEIAAYMRSQSASFDLDSEDDGSQMVIPGTDRESQRDDTHAQETLALGALRSECSDLRRQVADLQEQETAKAQEHTHAQSELRQQLSEAEKALGDKDTTLGYQKDQLRSLENSVSGFEIEVKSLRQTIADLQAGVIQNDDMLQELRESRDQVELLTDQVKLLKTDAESKSELEKELAHHKVRAENFEHTNGRLRKDVKNKTDLLESCTKVRDSAQALADKCKEELSRKTTELDEVRTLQKKTRQRLGSVSESEQIFKGKYAAEYDLREATLAGLKKEEAKCGEMEARIGTLEARIGTLEASIKSKDDEVKSRDDEVKTLKSSNRSKDEQIVLKDEEIRSLRESAQAKQDELADLTRQIAEKEQQLEGKRADLEKTGMDKADVERDLGLVLSLSIHASDVRVQDWVPLLRSLRDSAPAARSSPGENLLAPVWAILPSWVDPSPEEETGPGYFELPAVPTSPDGLLFELFGHAMADGDIRSGECLRALASLSAHVGRHGLTKVSSFIIVLEELVTRAQKLEAVTGYNCMLLLGLKYLASLTRSRVQQADALGLSVIEASLDALMEKVGKSLGVIRHVTDALCASGDFEACEPTCFLRLNSVQGHKILIFAQPRHPDELFLLADPEKRTVWAVSLNRYESKITVDEDGKLVKGAIIRAPAGQPDIELALTDKEYNWILKCL